MISRLIAIMFLCSCTSSLFAQISEVPDSSAVNGVGKIFTITNSEFINVTVESTSEIFGYVQSIPQKIVINVAKPVPEINATTLTVKNLAAESTYFLVKEGTIEEIVTDENGTYSFDADLAQPAKYLIVMNP